MHVTFVNLPNKFDACEVYNAVIFYGEKIMSKRMLALITIRIEFVENLEAHYNIIGDCSWEDDNYRPREFIIRLDANAGKRKMLISLAHEMVHVKQFAKSEMRDTRHTHIVMWGREAVNTDDIDYWDLPWEIEAHGREAGLYVRFKSKWLKEKKHAKATFKTQSNSASTAHTLVCKKSYKK